MSSGKVMYDPERDAYHVELYVSADVMQNKHPRRELALFVAAQLEDALKAGVQAKRATPDPRLREAVTPGAHATSPEVVLPSLGDSCPRCFCRHLVGRCELGADGRVHTSCRNCEQRYELTGANPKPEVSTANRLEINVGSFSAIDRKEASKRLGAALGEIQLGKRGPRRCTCGGGKAGTTHSSWCDKPTSVPAPSADTFLLKFE